MEISNDKSEILNTELSGTLGDILRNERCKAGLEIADLANETRISETNLRAMEEDNYQALPATAFAKGLYTIYAKELNLDIDNVLKRFKQEITSESDKDRSQNTPTRLIKEVGAMAERPAVPPIPILGTFILLIIIIITLICLYYSINPATYLSEKLRGLQEQSEPATQSEDTGSLVTDPKDFNLLASTSLINQNQHAGPYTIRGNFNQQTKLVITVDNEEEKSLIAEAGEKISWKADKSIEMELPANTSASISLNGTLLDLPPPRGNVISLVIP